MAFKSFTRAQEEARAENEKLRTYLAEFGRQRDAAREASARELSEALETQKKELEAKAEEKIKEAVRAERTTLLETFWSETVFPQFLSGDDKGLGYQFPGLLIPVIPEAQNSAQNERSCVEIDLSERERFIDIADAEEMPMRWRPGIVNGDRRGPTIMSNANLRALPGGRGRRRFRDFTPASGIPTMPMPTTAK